MSDGILQVSGLHAGYQPDMAILKGVDLALREGEFTVLLGPNGAGKSTLVKTIAGLVPVHAGAVHLDGTEITALPAHQKLRQGLAFVPQTENIFARMSIRENLLIAAQILPKAQRAERIAAMYDTFPDLARAPNRRAGALSGGQRQMLAVARALIVAPRLLILDEPSAGLSPMMVGEVFERLAAINARRRHHPVGRTECAGRSGYRRARRDPGRRPVAHDAPSDVLRDDPVVADLYLGGKTTETTP